VSGVGAVSVQPATVDGMDREGAASAASIDEPCRSLVLRQAISATVREGRARLVLSQRELAAAAGVSQSAVARLEAGTGDPQLSGVVTVLGVVGARLWIPAPGTPTRMAGEYARDAGERRLPAHLQPYRLVRPHDWWPGTTNILMWRNEPKWSYRRRATG
jgi:transcriptional regulator with XRE-family HTH domain